jgi:CBS-domain-containing membrane protein
MSDPFIYCTAAEDLDDAVRIIERDKTRRLPVSDEHCRMAGMLSLLDVRARAPPSLISETLRAVSAHHA